ncbi:hypothetical protein PtrSN002B_003453 [Pyrenophora tritici-repentis]|uniref:Uncharacterized protein n=2 Tax=Pyrenophora tritici-repentis TaxID=45151 RepID=A0A2W1GYH0_9PLEO|nr:uncharacterized protein PTRG_06936 [Pyrenophora tritici-repentis Pt-1C-BFP]KAA8614451.1 hypothetical protein PtrV1_11481 [Pyrenophora tritici-repentis]EDU49856.1 hypothetical protein PTRG_06936 [Pyrenophora tritici-repentis Pt-1C-BFP]KAF7444282.1 hypothetical protein A1F99_108350 [Pyrenophora tritici-repentis]KAF7565068.1 hypothetical protein PtrM4_045020 [Pyrenophora tritici-repentis]KAG9378534.1 hypothetical protein A1F94_010303 [Pyrenophora tritici-repentis]
MSTTAAPHLRRSKRKRNYAAIKQVHAPTPAPARKRRAPKSVYAATDPSIVLDSHGSVNAAVTDNSTRQHTNTLSRFLALPRELRDEIYKHILDQDNSSTLKPGSRNIATRCGLAGVNNQISEEFLDAVLFHAPVITTTVRNHNFGPVVTFLNRLSQAQLTRLSTRGSQVNEADDDARPKRKMRIILSYSAGAKDSRAHLNRWLDRFDVPEKRGKEIEFEYEGDGTYRNGGYKQRPKTRDNASARWNEEAAKIGTAAARGVRVFGGWGF